MEPSTSNLPSLRFAVLFAYNGLPFDGLERYIVIPRCIKE